jgi:oligopeptide/dipeptide ABC transporter ATP-binding protein
MSMVLVTHDIGVVAGRCDRVGVMYAGRLVESGPVPAVLGTPSHPYTSALLGSIPRIDAPRARLKTIPGALPDPAAPIEGCPFAPRCEYALEVCGSWDARLEVHAGDQSSACWRHRELADALAAVAR